MNNPTTLQDEIDDIVKRIKNDEVYCLANELIEVASKDESIMDDLYSQLLIKVDIEATIENERHRLSGSGDEEDLSELEERIEQYGEEKAISYLDIDLVYSEPLQFWVVSDWLYRKLGEQDEPIEEVYGLNIWGRTTCGQCLSYDSVIQRIAHELATKEY